MVKQGLPKGEKIYSPLCHLAWNKFPGFLLASSSEQYLEEIALSMLSRFFCSVLSGFFSISENKFSKLFFMGFKIAKVNEWKAYKVFAIALVILCSSEISPSIWPIK